MFTLIGKILSLIPRILSETPSGVHEMGDWNLTPDDLKRGDLVEPRWKPVDIIDYEEKEAETDGSTNCIFHFKIFDGPAAEKGVRLQRLFNEKALGFGKRLWEALEFPYDPVLGYKLSSGLFRQAIGSKLEVYVKRGKSNKGNDFNEVADFRKLGAAVASTKKSA